MARTAKPELVDGSLPVFNAAATVTQPHDPAPFSLSAGVELLDNGELKVTGANVHRAVSPYTGTGLPDGFVMPGGSVLVQR